jgi:ParB family chromosome partitioning protein
MRFTNQPTVSSTGLQNETGRDIRLLDVDLIDPNPLAPREVYTAEMIQTRAEELKSQGQRDPIHVIPNPDAIGRFIIADGWTRVQACLKHQALEKILAEIHSDLSLESSAWLGWENNEGRAAHTDIDRGLFFAKLMEHGEIAAEIAEKAKISEAAMTYFKAYAKLPPEVLSVMREYPAKFGSLVAYNVQRIAEKLGTDDALNLIGRYIKDDHNTRWIIGQVKALLATPVTRIVPAQQRSLKYRNGYLKTRSDGRVEVAIHVAPEKLEAFSLALEALLATVANPVATEVMADSEA